MPDQTLAQRIRAKYPGAYDDLDDAALESSVRAKYPGVYDDLPTTTAQPKADAGPHQPTEDEWATMPANEKARALLSWAGHAVAGAFMPGDAGQQAVDHPVATLATAAIPGVMQMAASHGAPLVQTAARSAIGVLDNPLVGAGVGGAVGGYNGGTRGAVTGAIAGAAGSSALTRGLKNLARTSASQQMVRGMSAAGAAPVEAPAPATPPPAPQEALIKELLAREPDWRTTDAVPIDAITRDVSRGGSIIEAGESQLGLSDRLAQVLKDVAKKPAAEQLAEADRLARALRQRQHITAQTTGARR